MMRLALLALTAAVALVASGCTSPPADLDGDGLTDALERRLGLDPARADTDGDGLHDGDERRLGLDPSVADTDLDGVADGLELADGLDPLVPDSIVFRLAPVGRDGPEPSVGVTSSGCIFFAALEQVLRSCDAGASWEPVQGLLSPRDTSDPFLWVSPATDRIFNVQMVDLLCTWIAWSDDDGASWTGNPWDCGPIPVNDHIKLATGPWTGALGALGLNPAYPEAVYFCYNKLVGVFCYTSLDGGATFTLGGRACDGGLHGAVTAAPDGTLYVPPRLATPTVCVSRDNGLTWSVARMGDDVGTPNPRKNSEVATDTASNAYHTWVGKNFGVHLARSLDSGATWDATSLRVSPEHLVSATFPHIQAGSPGRVAVAYLASADAHLLGTPDLDGRPWDGNPHTAPAQATYDLYVSVATDALAPQPTWRTAKVTADPVQVGSICIFSGDCRNIGGSNRNLLDFNDLSLDRDGRLYVAFTDGCVGACAEGERHPESSRARQGVLAVLEVGPSLHEEKGRLPPLLLGDLR